MPCSWRRKMGGRDNSLLLLLLLYQTVAPTITAKQWVRLLSIGSFRIRMSSDMWSESNSAAASMARWNENGDYGTSTTSTSTYTFLSIRCFCFLTENCKKKKTSFAQTHTQSLCVYNVFRGEPHEKPSYTDIASTCCQLPLLHFNVLFIISPTTTTAAAATATKQK